MVLDVMCAGRNGCYYDVRWSVHGKVQYNMREFELQKWSESK